ncbi:MAG: ATPase, T2SS/T4P/T4SS family [Candidatus Delongbacteria bacterium]|nr:ATPase, T2SS/T4P/T4SS family [Candidatus Delongbacteria bacterium]
MLNAEIIDKDEEIVKFVNDLLEKAVKEGVSDVHIEPQATNTRVRFRKDGKLYVVEGYDNIPKQLHDYIIAQVKILTGTMKLDVKTRPQDGKIIFFAYDKRFVFRLLLYPTIHGESINIYNMDDQVKHYSIEELFNNDTKLIEMFRRNLKKEEGLFLFTGPSTAGKSTFIASTINELADTGVKIRTIEDPVELQMDNTDQIQISNNISMLTACRQACRGDVDVLYISELRQFEVAHIALEVGTNKGYKVISTMHTNNGISTLFRFTEMGIKEYMTASCLELVVGLRRTKKLCPHCKEKADLLESEFKGFGLTEKEIQNGKFYKAKGCDKCFNTGYAGKLALVEMLEFTRSLKDAFVKGADPEEMEKLAKKEGVIHTFADDTRRKFLNGDIDIEEAIMFMF